MEDQEVMSLEMARSQREASVEPAGATALLLSFVERRDHSKLDENGSRNGPVKNFKSALSSLCIF